MVEFKARTISASYTGMMVYGVANSNGDASSFRILDTIYATGSWDTYTIFLDAGIASGDARFGFIHIQDGLTFDYWMLDDIVIKDIPPCPEPTALALSGATRNSATLSWLSSSSAFDIEVGPTGYSQGTGATYTSTNTSYAVTGLTQNTYYDAYVMANCTATGDGTSAWVGPLTFKTECGSFATPYTETFRIFRWIRNTANPDLPDC